MSYTPDQGFLGFLAFLVYRSSALSGNFGRFAALSRHVYVTLGFCTVLLSASAAACPYTYDQMRAERVNAIMDQYDPTRGYNGPPVTIWLGDSHTGDLSKAFPQGYKIIAGGKVLFLGFPGATVGDLLRCFDWSRAERLRPIAMVAMLGVNDANRETCCYPNGYATPAFLGEVLDLRDRMRRISGRLYFVTDPPTEASYPINRMMVHNAARIVYYVAVDFGGGTFVDPYSRLWPQDCAEAWQGWDGRACVAPPLSTYDTVHLNHSELAKLVRLAQEAR